MIKIDVKNYGVYDIEESMSLLELLKKIDNKQLYVAAKVNGVTVDLSKVIDENTAVELVSAESKEAQEIIRHSTAHLMAQAVQRLFPAAKKFVGPATEDGFYYDFDIPKNISENELPAIEAEMKKIVSEDLVIVREELKKDEAKKLFTDLGETDKIAILDRIAEPAVTIYRQGEYVDLCRGPHVPSTSFLKAFKLKSVSSVYINGKEGKSLQRIYGYAYDSEEALNSYLKFVEEQQRRDHRKISKELDLFMFSEYSNGIPFYTPKGMAIRNSLEELTRNEHRKAGYKQIKTPILLDKKLWEISGHWGYYKDNMFITEPNNETYALKPMNCPGSLLYYKSKLRSYKEFPMRVLELGTVFRNELSGVSHGLLRTREFTQDDAHVYITEKQVEQEISAVIDLVDRFYSKIFNFEYSIEISTRPEKFIGTEEVWEKATESLKKTVASKGKSYKVNEGDGAFYGPKIDFHINSYLGKSWQCATIQLDFNLPERFDLEYVGEDGLHHRPIMLHRVIYGSMERFIGILIEHYEGKFPLWLAPIQAVVISISEDNNQFAKEVADKMLELGLRVELDLDDDKIGLKIRRASLQKIPFQVIIGKRELENRVVTVRRLGSQDSESYSLDEFLKMAVEECRLKA